MDLKLDLETIVGLNKDVNENLKNSNFSFNPKFLQKFVLIFPKFIST